MDPSTQYTNQPIMLRKYFSIRPPHTHTHFVMLEHESMKTAKPRQNQNMSATKFWKSINQGFVMKNSNIPQSDMQSITKRQEEFGVTATLPRGDRPPNVSDRIKRALVRKNNRVQG